MNTEHHIPGNYRVLRKATRSVRIKIRNDLTVDITVPFNFSEKHILEIIAKKKKWIDRHLEIFSKRKKIFALKENELVLFGELFEFAHRPELRRKTIIDRESRRIESGNDILADAKSKYGFYKKLASEYISKKAEAAAKEHGFSFNRLFIRSQKTKWGTCSSAKNISFNWRLVICPEYVCDYLIIHELVHTEIMNHSKKYWERVGLLFPEYKKAKKWLDDNSYAVHRI
ncbi:MAG: M48 family metallopeptidase [Bacteroidetes bacterium]|nr:M48 family metallopeptidase [Bacteroidota bacterium]